jgi:hypothetical protein
VLDFVTTLAVVMASWLVSSLISNHHLAGSIIVIHESCKGSDPFRLMIYGPMMSTQSLSHGSEASLIGKCPYSYDSFCISGELSIWNIHRELVPVSV